MHTFFLQVIRESNPWRTSAIQVSIQFDFLLGSGKEKMYYFYNRINIIRERDSMWANINAIVARCVFISYIIYAFASFLKLCLRRCIFMYNSVSWHYITWYKIRYFSWIKTKETNSLPNIYLQANLHNTFYICTTVYLNQSINPW